MGEIGVLGKRLQTEIAEILESLDKNDRDLQTVKAEKSLLIEENQKSKFELKSCLQNIEFLEASISKLEVESAALASELKAAQTLSSEQTRQLEDLREKALTALREQKQQYQQKLLGMEAQLKHAERIANRAEATLVELRESFDVRILKQQETIAALKGELDVRERSAREEKQNWEILKSSLVSRIDSLESQVSSIQLQNRELKENELVPCRAQLEKEVHYSGELRAELERVNQKLLRESRLSEKLRAQIETLLHDLTDWKDKGQKLTESILERDRLQSELQTQLSSMTRELSGARSDAQKMKRTYADSEAMAQEQIKQLECRLRATESSSSKTVTQLRDQMALLESEYQTRINELTRESRDFAQELGEAKKSIAALEENINLSQNQIRNSSEELRGRDRTILDLRAEILEKEARAEEAMGVLRHSLLEKINEVRLLHLKGEELSAQNQSLTAESLKAHAELDGLRVLWDKALTDLEEKTVTSGLNEKRALELRQKLESERGQALALKSQNLKLLKHIKDTKIKAQLPQHEFIDSKVEEKHNPTHILDEKDAF